MLAIRGTDLITAPGHTMEEAQSWSRLAIDPTIAAPVTGTDACITCGSPVIGHGEMAGKCGSGVITSRGVTEPRQVLR
jgi:hypothetical protein